MAALVELSLPDEHPVDAARSDDVPVPVLEPPLERLVAARRSGDPDAVRRREADVVRHYRPFADRLARRYRGRGVEEDDLLQLARLGLCKAVRRWQPQLDPTLVQFAGPTIEGEIKRYFRDHCRPIRMPRSLQEDLALHQSIQEELVQSLGRAPADHELAAAAGSSVARVRRQRVASRMCQPLSADAPAGSLIDGVRCEASTRATAKLDELLSLGAAVRRLPARDRRVLGLRFMGELSQSEIALRLGVSQMQVSRILRSIMTRLRAQLS
jgi:RNA polymerase sigma-B factor